MTESFNRKLGRLAQNVSGTGTITTNAATASTWQNARTITLGGDLSGNVSIDGSENVTLTATVSGNTVALGTDTTGDYVATVSAGTGITTTGTGEGAAVTISIDNTVATLTGSQTLTNKTISGSNNTITNIGNGSLTNSSVTVNGTSIALGSSGTLVTDDIAEDGSPVNLWFTNTRARNAVSVTDAGGDGSFTYDSGTGVFTYTGPSATEVRAHLSAGTGLTFTTGQFAIDSTVVTLTGSQTLTNKTLTSPIISSISNTGTLTLPTSTDTLVGRATTDTLTNKTISGADNTISNIGNSSLTNSSITINGTATSLGGTRTLVTDDIAEDGSPVNLWYTDGRARAAISVTDAGGDGSLTYNSGVITYTGPSASEVRAHFSAGTGVTITSGQVAIGQAVGTSDNVTFAGVTADNIRVGVTATNEIDTSSGNLTLDSTGGTTVMDDDVNVTGNMTIDGNLTVSGTTVTINATNLAVEDNMIYLNSGSTVTHPDLGFAGNYNDGTYRHAGLFRDESDGRWKFFHQYTPEPDASAYIDITHASFALAPVQASSFIGSLTGNASTASAWATGRTLTLTGDVTGTSAAFDGSGNISITTTIAADSVALGTDTTGDYVAAVAVSGTGLSVAGSGENATYTITSNATSANTASTIVARDASGNFTAGTITAALVLQGSNQVLHAGNYTSYALPLSGGTLTGVATFTGGGTAANVVLDKNIASPANYYNGLQLEVRATSGTAGIALHRGGYSHVGIYHDSINELKFNMNSGTVTMPYNVGTVIGSSNYTSYVNYGNPSTRGVYQISNWNQTTYPNTHFLSSENDVTNAPTTDYTYGLQYSFHRDGASYRTQMVTALYSNLSIYVRNSRDSDAWTSWKELLHSGNYNSYSPTLTGGNASGTWGISISGNAATATSATTAGALSSMNISQFTNNSGYITGLSFDGLSSKGSGTGTYTTSGDFRAPIFYDSNNTGYYTDPASVSNINNLLIASAVTNANGGTRNVMPAGGIYTTSASSVSGAIVIKLPVTAYPMIRFTVKVYTYDGLSFDINCGGHTSSGIWYNTFAYMTTATRSALNVRFTYGDGEVYVYIGELGSSWSYPQVFITDVQVGYTSMEYTNWDDGWTITFNASTYKNVSSTHVVYPPMYSSNNTSAAYATIFYDNNNTGYYVDPASTSNLNSVSIATLNGHTLNADNYLGRYGNSYYQVNTWLASTGAHGLYWPNYYGAHLYANTGSSYTQIRLDGQKSGYDGMWLSYSSVNGMMYDSAGNGGVYREANGRWYFYYHLGNDCMGIGTSSTNSAYSLYLNKGVYAQSRIDGTVFYDSNDTGYYIDPNSTSVTALRVRGGAVFGPNTSWGAYLQVGGNSREYVDNASYASVATSYGNLHMDAASGYAMYLNYYDGSGIYFGNGATGTWGEWSSGIFYSYGQIRGTIFYDHTNTGYYCDPASTSIFNVVSTGNTLYVNNNGESVATTAFRGIQFHIDSDMNYYIGKPAGAWTQPLHITFYTGIRLRSDQSYGGTQFYNISSGSTVMAVNNGDNNVHVYTNFYAPIMYDENNTGYYVDPASTSNLNALQTYSYQGNGNVGGTGAASWHPNGIYSGSTQWLYGAIHRNGAATYGGGPAYYAMMYDNNDSAYYSDPAGTTRIYDLTLAGAKHTYLNISPGNGYEAMVYYNGGGSGSAWYVGKRTTSQVVGTGDLHFYSVAASATVGGIDTSGNFTASGNVTAYSDVRLKKNIQRIENALQKISKISGYTFERMDTSMRQAGVIAQEVLEVLPEVVLGSEETQYSVAYGNMVGLLIEAIKEQQAKIEELENRINNS